MKTKKKIDRNKEKPVQKYRFITQSVIALICVWIGVEFYFFVNFLESGGVAANPGRPAGVEGFLPISAMMSVYYWIVSGDLHGAHPAGAFIFLGIVGMSFFMGKSFCSWMCPVGFISELVGDFGDKMSKKVFKRKIKMPKFLDWPLRSLKYLLLGFFVYSIFFSMSTAALRMFLDSPYNLVADVKMYYFFADISRTSLIVIGSLFVLSIFFKNFWCRYLCPYGALLGITSFFSPNKIKREESSCIDCNLCTKACPSFIDVAKKKTVISDECTSCLSCVDACPVKDTLYVKSSFTKSKISKPVVAMSIVFIYVIIIGIGMLTGNWESKISATKYLSLQENIHSMGHPRGGKEIEALNKKAAENKTERLGPVRD